MSWKLSEPQSLARRELGIGGDAVKLAELLYCDSVTGSDAAE